MVEKSKYYVKEIVRPNYLTREVERLKFKPPKEKEKKKEKKKDKKKLLKKPKAKLPSVNPQKFITSGLGKPSLVKKGRTGYFKEEYIKEKQEWLS